MGADIHPHRLLAVGMACQHAAVALAQEYSEGLAREQTGDQALDPGDAEACGNDARKPPVRTIEAAGHNEAGLPGHLVHKWVGYEQPSIGVIPMDAKEIGPCGHIPDRLAASLTAPLDNRADCTGKEDIGDFGRAISEGSQEGWLDGAAIAQPLLILEGRRGAPEHLIGLLQAALQVVAHHPREGSQLLLGLSPQILIGNVSLCRGDKQHAYHHYAGRHQRSDPAA